MSAIYEITIHKTISITNKNYESAEEARLDGARVKNIYQAEDPSHEYWFDYKQVEEEE